MEPKAWPNSWHVLHPRDRIGLNQTWRGRFSQWIRRESKQAGEGNNVPSGLQIGDIIMYCPAQPNAKQILIQSAQREAFAEEHAWFTHIALYVGDGNVVDSISVTGISMRPLWTLTEDGYVRIRRVKGIRPNQQRAVSVAAQQTRSKYAKIAALAEGMRMMGIPIPERWERLLGISTYQKGKEGNGVSEHILYCGQLVDIVYLKVLNLSVVDGDVIAPVPAAFSANNALFEDVVAHWQS